MTSLNSLQQVSVNVHDLPRAVARVRALMAPPPARPTPSTSWKAEPVLAEAIG